MKKYNTLYYLLFVFIIMGSFAAMAQNDYGITILGLAAFSFSLLFTIQLFFSLTAQGKKWWNILELTNISLLAFIMGLRVFYIHFEFVELVFALAGILLMIVYVQRIFWVHTSVKANSKMLIGLLVAYYLSIVFYIFSMLSVPFFPMLSEPAGIIAFSLLIIFGASGLAIRNVVVNEENVSGFKVIARLRDRSVVLVILFFLFTVYMGFNKIGLIPQMYSNEFPQGYYQLVNRAESRKEKPVDGKYKHEEFKEKYDHFVGRISGPNKK